MGVPISPVGGTRTHDPTPPRRGATHNSADFGHYSRTRPSARGKRNWRGVCKAITQPQTPPRRAFGATTKRGRIRGFHRRSPKRRGAAGRGLFLCRFRARFLAPKSRFHFAFISPPPRSFPLFRRRSSIAPPTRPTHPKSGNPHPAPSTPRPPQRTENTHRQHHQRREPSNPTARVSRQMPQGNRSCASCACRIANPEWGG